MVKLSAELHIYLNLLYLPGVFDKTIKFNSSTGKELLTLNNSRGGTEVANAKLYGLLRTFPTFLPDQQARVGSLLQTEEFLPGTSLLSNVQIKKISP